MIFWIFAWEGAGGFQRRCCFEKRCVPHVRMYVHLTYSQLCPRQSATSEQGPTIQRSATSHDHIGIQWCNVMRIIKLSQYQTCNKTGSFSWDFGPRDLLIGALGFSTFMNSVALNHLAKTCPWYIWRPRNITSSIMPFDITACEVARQLDTC